MLDRTLIRRLRYTLYAPFYDFAAAEHREDRRRAIDLLRLAPRDRVLVVGAGTGADLEHLPASADVLATDLTPAMLERARQRARGNVDLAVMDGQRLDLPSASFDAVLLHQVLGVVPRPDRCLAEAARVTRPGGRVSILDKFLPDDEPPRSLRRLAYGTFDVVFTSAKWSVEELLAAAQCPLAVVHEERCDGPFRILLLEK